MTRLLLIFVLIIRLNSSFGLLSVKARAAKALIIATTLWGPSSAGADNFIIGPNSGVGVDGIGLFNLCPDPKPFPRCVSSQDDRPANFQAPWCYDGSFKLAKAKLLAYVTSKYNVQVSEGSVDDEERYLRMYFPVKGGGSRILLDVVEFYFTPNDNLIQFRGERKLEGEEGFVPISDFGANSGLMESIRIGCRLESVPVLRNRKRALFFIESPFDSFGPSTSDLNQI